VLINMTGTGMYVTSSAVFFVKYVGMPAGQVGVGLTVGGLIGLSAGVPMGRLADHRGPRDVYTVTLLVEAVAMCLLLTVRSLWAFVLVTTVVGLAASSSNAARGPLIRGLAGENPTHLRAHLRSVTNLGITLGGAAAGWAIAANNRGGYPLLVLGNAASFAICSLLVRRLPRIAPVPGAKAAAGRRRLADPPYLALSGVNLVMMFQYPVLSLVLPLWILGHTAVPRWLIATLIPVNTLMVALLQTRMSRRITGPRAAAACMVRAGALLLAAFALVGVVRGLPRWPAVAAVAVALVLLTFGEILYAAASYELSFDLAPEHAQGQYLGVYNLGGGLGRVVSPSVATLLCLDVGAWGWVALGLLLLAGALATPPVVGWSLRTAASRHVPVTAPPGERTEPVAAVPDGEPAR
jgi:MFS family permease